jgi:hypothetical protein
MHLALLSLPLAVLPLAVNPALLRGGESNPILDVLVLLSLAVGLPFLVVSATAPLIQKWFTHTGHPAARDPYFLYAASNLGSMLALLGYPTLIEPGLHLRGEGWLTQTRLWSLAISPSPPSSRCACWSSGRRSASCPAVGRKPDQIRDGRETTRAAPG